MSLRSVGFFKKNVYLMKNSFLSKNINRLFSNHSANNNGSSIIPVIDISSSYKGGKEAKVIGKQIDKACREIGFFAITGYNIDPKVINSTWNITREYFDLPVSEKIKIQMTNDYPYGYSGFREEVLSASLGQVSEPDLKESFTIGPYNPASGLPLIRYPSSPSSFKEIWHNYFVSMENLSAHVLSLFALGLDLPNDFFANKITKHRSALRALNYPEQDIQKAPVGAIRAGDHTDYGTLTILRQDSTGGLQVRSPFDGTWHNVPAIPNSFVINVGDLMQRWTNDAWISTRHRVVNPPQLQSASSGVMARRQSMAYFQNINGDETVECIPTVLKPGEKPKYQPINSWDFLIQKHTSATSKY